MNHYVTSLLIAFVIGLIATAIFYFPLSVVFHKLLKGKTTIVPLYAGIASAVITTAIYYFMSGKISFIYSLSAFTIVLIAMAKSKKARADLEGEKLRGSE